MPNCSICCHDSVSAIDQALAARQPLREIAERYGLGRMSLHRHKSHVQGSLISQAEARQAAEAGTLESKIEQLITDGRRILLKAEKAGQLSVSVQAVKALADAIETFAKIRGELQTGTQQVNVAAGITIQISSIDAKL